MLKSVSTSLVPLYCAPPQKPLSLSLCVRLCKNCHFLFQSTYFESGVWGTSRLLFCPVSPSRGQVRSQELFSGGKQNLKNFTLRHVLAGCGPYVKPPRCSKLKRKEKRKTQMNKLSKKEQNLAGIVEKQQDKGNKRKKGN